MERAEKIEQLLTRNVETVIEAKHLREALLSGKRLRVKLGIDPTSPDLHLGHAVVLQKLREFQDLGCLAVLIIGDFTGQIGDPSGRDKTRPPLSEKEVKANLRNYLKQAGKIIDLKKAETVRNSKWLGVLSGRKLLELLGSISLQQIIERDDFKKRLAEHNPVRMHELLYPILQAYDSVNVKADVELGGTDQTFNLMVGRDLMEKFHLPPQDVMTSPLLEGLDGVKKMSKSLGNYVGLTDEPEDMFGKIMSLPDPLMEKYFTLCTALAASEIKELAAALDPKSLKMRLSREIVGRYHGERAADRAAESFDKLFSKKMMPDELPEIVIKSKTISALELVFASGALKSKGEARRLIEQGGFEFDSETVKDPQKVLEIGGGEPVRIGKKRFFRVIHS